MRRPMAATTLILRRGPPPTPCRSGVTTSSPSNRDKSSQNLVKCQAPESYTLFTRDVVPISANIRLLSSSLLSRGSCTVPYPAKVSRQSHQKKLILCIDDHRQGLHARRLILQSAGYDVVTASSGRIGLRLLGRHPVHLVILDYSMPEMNGEAVAREIRRSHPRVPILMLSGQIDVPKRAVLAVDAFVAKGQPPTVMLGQLTALASGRTREAPPQ